MKPEQFKNLLREVLNDEVPRHLEPIKNDLDQLRVSVDGLAVKFDTLNQEFTVHRKVEHPKIDDRLTRLEKHTGLVGT